MASESDLFAAVTAIYEAAVDFKLWPHALGRLAAALGVPSASMMQQSRHAAGCWGLGVGIDPAMIDDYLRYYHDLDLLSQSTLNSPAGTVHTDTMVVPRRELIRTEFFNDFLLPQRVQGLLNVVVLHEHGCHSIVTLHDERPFEHHHVALYKMLTPHLQRAAQINFKLAGAELKQIASTQALDRLDDGVIFVGLDAAIVFANDAALAFFAQRSLRQSKGRLHGNSTAETAALHAAIAKCAQAGSQGGLVSLSREPGGSPLSLLVAPLALENPCGLAAKPMAMIFVSDPDRKGKPAAAQLQDRFGMTAAEARFALEIMTGDGIQAAADRLSVTPSWSVFCLPRNHRRAPRGSRPRQPSAVSPCSVL
jgi:hypothetical protein